MAYRKDKDLEFLRELRTEDISINLIYRGRG
ncbi:DUF3944 domain-containing protein [Helicobacter pullorum]